MSALRCQLEIPWQIKPDAVLTCVYLEELGGGEVRNILTASFHTAFEFFLHYCILILTVYFLALICCGYEESFDLSAKKKKSIVYFSDDWSWKLSKNQNIQKNHSLHLQYSSIKLCVCRFISCPPKIYICIVISKSSFWMLPANMQESFWKMVTHIGNIMVKLYICFAFFGEKTLSPTPPSTN